MTSLLPPIKHLGVADVVDPDLVITVRSEDNLWRVLMNGEPKGEALAAASLVPYLTSWLRRASVRRVPYVIAIHAAVVTAGSRTLVVAGASGAGKSTLAASLLARGHRLLTDETAVLDADGSLVPFPLGLGLKTGSWAVLEKDYPHLASLPEYLDWDGNAVRYLDASMVTFAEGGKAFHATHLVFPHFRPGGVGGIKKVSLVQAVRALTEGGYSVQTLDTSSVDRIVAWLEGLQCYSCTYASNEEALRQLREVGAA